MSNHYDTPEKQQVIDQVIEQRAIALTTKGRCPSTGTLGTKQARAFCHSDPTATDIQIANIRFRHDPTIEDGIKLDGEEPWNPTLHQQPKTAQDVLTEWRAKAPAFESLHDGHRSNHLFRSWMEAPEPPKPTQDTTAGWKGKLHHDRSQYADWGWIRDEAGELIAIVKTPPMTDEEINQHRRNGTDPAQARVDLILAAING